MTLFNLGERRSGPPGTSNPFENPAVPLSSIGLDNVFGALTTTDSGESVTQENSMTLPTIW